MTPGADTSDQARVRLGQALAVFGTASDVGKSLIAAGLCRLLRDAGLRVAPFKAQNMSNNSGVTSLGLEMGRAQIVQALGAGVEPHVDMNPVLLKPGSDDGSQVVLLGEPWKNRNAKSYFGDAPELARHAYAALDRLREHYDCVVIEGAGSCAEVNLRAREFVNFPCAHHADARVVLVADIDRGGVFAQVVGSLEVIPPEDRARVSGIIINRFRGDLDLFHDGVQYLEERTGLPVLGVVPFLYDLHVDAEDSLQLHALLDPPWDDAGDAGGDVRIAVLRLPHVSNSTDFESLAAVPGVQLHFLSRPRALDGYDLVIIPGSKNVRADLAWLRSTGWVERLDSYRQKKGRVAGICGGYQLLGRTIRDPEGIEGSPGSSEGLGYLPLQTVLERSKVLTNVSGTWARYGVEVRGYEIHMGQTTESRAHGEAAERLQPAIEDLRGGHGGVDGTMQADGLAWGTYLHGLFDSHEFLVALLSELSPGARWADRVSEAQSRKHESLDRLARHLAEHLDMNAIRRWVVA